jgi:O-antigen/teichoic acid export membrane protein
MKSKAKSGMLWSFMISGGGQIINFVVTIFLSRLLLPEQFGLIGMISIFLAIGLALVDGGFVSSLIRTKDADDLDYSSVFFMNLFSSLFLYGILFFTAPFVAAFFNHDILIDLIRVQSLILIISAFSLVQSTKLNKELQFKTQFKLQIPALLISAIAAISFAYYGFGVWSLVAKELIYSFLATAQLWWYAKWKPTFVIDKNKIKYHFKFGYKVSLTAILNTCFKNLYNVLIGKYFSATQLGYFTRAKSLEQLPSQFFFNSINRVFYPLLAEVDDDGTKLKNVYARLMKLVVFVVTPILIYLGVIAEPFIRFLITDKWLPAVPYFQLLLLSGIFYPIHSYNLNICNLKGRSDVVLKLSFFHNTLLFLGSFSIIWFGIYGLLCNLVLVNLLVTIINSYISGQFINYGLKEQSKDLVPILVLNIVFGLIFYLIQINYFGHISDIWNIIVNGFVFFVTYVGFAFITKMSVIEDIMKLIKK